MRDNIVLRPQVSEKTSDHMSDNKYTFFVSSDVNKVMIRQMIEKKYGVTVEKVNVLWSPSKKRRRGRIVGKTARRKKAIVSLKEGDVIPDIKEQF